MDFHLNCKGISVQTIVFASILGILAGAIFFLNLEDIFILAILIIPIIMILPSKTLIRFIMFILPMFPLFTHVAIEQSISSSIVFILYGLLIIISFFKGLINLQKVCVDKNLYFAIALFGVYLLVSGLLSGRVEDINSFIILLFGIIPYFWFLTSGRFLALVYNRNSVCSSFVYGAALSAIWYIIQTITVIGISTDSIHWATVVLAMNFNLNNIGLLYALGFAMLIPLEMNSYKWMKWILGIILVIATLFTFSRSSYLAILFLIVMLFWKQIRQKRRIISVSLGILGILMLIMISPTHLQLVLERIQFTWESGWLDPSSAMRLMLWYQALETFLVNPIFGIGYGVPLSGNLVADASTLIFAHNYFLSLLSQLGILGFLLGAYILLRGYKLSFKEDLGKYGVGYKLSFITIFVASLFGEPLFWFGILFTFIVLLSEVAYRES